MLIMNNNEQEEIEETVMGLEGMWNYAKPQHLCYLSRAVGLLMKYKDLLEKMEKEKHENPNH